MVSPTLGTVWWHNKAIKNIRWKPAGCRQAALDATWHKRGRDWRGCRHFCLSPQQWAPGVWQKGCPMFIPDLLLVCQSASPRSSGFSCLTRLLPEHKAKVTGFSYIAINMAGATTFCTFQPSPYSSPAPSLASHIPLTWEPGTFCATAKPATWAQVEEEGWAHASPSLARPGHCTGRQSTTEEGLPSWSTCMASPNLPSTSCSTWQQSQASLTKAAECHEILGGEWEARRSNSVGSWAPMALILADAEPSSPICIK